MELRAKIVRPLHILLRSADNPPTIVCEAASEHCFLGKDGRFIRISKEYPEFWKTLTELVESE